MIQLKKLFEIELEQNDDIAMSSTCKGDLLLSPTSGGQFHGDELNGKIVPVGMGTTYAFLNQNDIKAELLLETDDGKKILLTIDAILCITDENEQKLMNGEIVDSESYYYKGIASFATGASEYKWLERKVCVCDGSINNWKKVSFGVYMI